jgi:hypothetical protein
VVAGAVCRAGSECLGHGEMEKAVGALRIC